jgi:hypothetical protein
MEQSSEVAVSALMGHPVGTGIRADAGREVVKESPEQMTIFWPHRVDE